MHSSLGCAIFLPLCALKKKKKKKKGEKNSYKSWPAEEDQTEETFVIYTRPMRYLTTLESKAHYTPKENEVVCRCRGVWERRRFIACKDGLLQEAQQRQEGFFLITKCDIIMICINCGTSIAAFRHSRQTAIVAHTRYRIKVTDYSYFTYDKVLLSPSSVLLTHKEGGNEVWRVVKHKSVEQRLNLSWSWQQRPLYNLQYPVHLSRLQRIYLPKYLKLSYADTQIRLFSVFDKPAFYDSAPKRIRIRLIQGKVKIVAF